MSAGFGSARCPVLAHTAGPGPLLSRAAGPTPRPGPGLLPRPRPDREPPRTPNPPSAPAGALRLLTSLELRRLASLEAQPRS